MTKEEKIKEAYGEHFQEGVNGDGYIRYGSEQNSEWHKTLEHNEWLGYHFYRPKSLQGIETNNGWIKIESEDDLPKESCHCWVIDKETGLILGHFLNNTKEDRRYWASNASHYQPLQTPKPPLY